MYLLILTIISVIWNLESDHSFSLNSKAKSTYNNNAFRAFGYISFEFIRLAGRYDNGFVNAISKPGLWLQKITVMEPDDDMIEVGIASVEAVFDWKDFQEKNKEYF